MKIKVILRDINEMVEKEICDVDVSEQHRFIIEVTNKQFKDENDKI